MTEERAQRLTKVGGWVSVACAIHCMIGPILLGLLPIIGASNELAERLEDPLILLSVVIGTAAILSAWREHRRRSTLALLGIALALLGAGRFIAGETLEMPLIVGGAGIMATAQFLNLRWQRDCCRRHAETSRSELSSIASRV